MCQDRRLGFGRRVGGREWESGNPNGYPMHFVCFELTCSLMCADGAGFVYLMYDLYSEVLRDNCYDQIIIFCIIVEKT